MNQPLVNRLCMKNSDKVVAPSQLLGGLERRCSIPLAPSLERGHKYVADFESQDESSLTSSPPVGVLLNRIHLLVILWWDRHLAFGR